jgi:hypothetical protein
MPSDALVALIKHVPEERAVRVALLPEPLRTQFVAVPPAASAYVTAPDPEPPVVPKDGVAEYVLPEPL